MASDSRAPARYKNAICASMGLLILFVTSFFVCEDYFNAKITQLIDGATLLKE